MIRYTHAPADLFPPVPQNALTLMPRRRARFAQRGAECLSLDCLSTSSPSYGLMHLQRFCEVLIGAFEHK